MKSRLAYWLIGLVSATGVLAGILAMPASAQTYGAGPYGACKVDVGCSSQTIINTKTGLHVAINLSEGQVIPLGFYNITVTPLNGQGRSFEKVMFYLDEKLIATFTPDQTGTATTAWDTTRDKGSRIVITVYDTDGSSASYNFNVTISNLPGAGAVTLPTAAGSSAQASNNPFQFLQNAVKALPTPVALSIPYVLLLVLLVIVLLLLWQSQREAKEAKRLRMAVARARQLAEEKDGFIELASHYLRTPLTLIKGGVDFLGAVQPPVERALIDGLLASTNTFGNNIETLLARASTDQRLAAIQPTSEIPKLRPLWTMWQFWVPLLSVGLLVLGMDWLLVSSGKGDVSIVNTLTQISFFMALGIGLYIVMRMRQTSRRDRAIAKQQEDQQIAIDETRNDLIRQAATVLADKLEAIRLFISRIPEGQARQFVVEGCDRIAQVLKRFRDTATVMPPITTMPFTAFRFSVLLAQAQSMVSEAAQAKQISIMPTAIQDVTLASQQPAWIVQVLSSLLDNAIAYSPEGSRVEVDAMVQAGKGILKVTDQGTGIPPNKLAELFQPFSKAEGPMQFDHPGLGLSLYLDRLLMTNLSGDIHIASQPSHGTTVTVSFPIQ